MTARIRDADARDAAGVAEIWNAVIRETARTFTTDEKTMGEIEARITSQPFWVASSDDQVLGFMTYGPFRAGPGYAATVEHSVYIHAAARGTGLGRRLMAHGMEHAKAAGLHVMVAGISGESTDAQRFHAALGFEEVGRLPQVGHKFGRWHDLVLMQKML